MSDKNYIAGDCSAGWLYIGIDTEPPPLGKKVHILSKGGISIHGTWNNYSGYLAYAPLMKRNKEKEAAIAKGPEGIAEYKMKNTISPCEYAD